MPSKGDVVDWIEGNPQMNQEDFIRRLEEEIHAAVAQRRAIEEEDALADDGSIDIPEGFKPNSEITQQVLEFLYEEKRWICVDGKLYHWTGTYYKHSKDAVETRRIRNFLNSFPVLKGEEIIFPYAKPASVKMALEWVKMSYLVDSDEVNPPGLNCTNGVLEIGWDGRKATRKLVPHDPDQYYTYEPIATYDPKADSTNCDKLLSCLDPAQREIFLRTIAASLDLETVRRYHGRSVKALLLQGLGSNGKDTLREVVSLMYGRHGLTGKAIADFHQYDQGRKFPLASLVGSRVNWASENANFSKLDGLQSLKAAITGDPLSKERKGKDEEEFTPESVFLFNCNDIPRIFGAMEAISSRYAVLRFLKTYKIGADPKKGEIEADPRFKYDREFLKAEVVPAFLNYVLSAWDELMRHGVDYTSTEETMQGIQENNSHLMRFCREVGLTYQEGAEVPVNEIWEKLKTWYEADGTLTYEETANGKQKTIWADQPNRWDRNCKGLNQIPARFLEIFPKAKRAKNSARQIILMGVGFNSVSLQPVCSQFAASSPKTENCSNPDEIRDKDSPPTASAASAVTLDTQQKKNEDSTKTVESELTLAEKTDQLQKLDAVDAVNVDD
ncbi:MAG: DUF5906 domain-containing protein, partial [Oscillatoria sp. PMC 1051.18]|nr:DUF5906 domain-containing protein [Oscillatoria sp. PMC 1051.18]